MILNFKYWEKNSYKQALTSPPPQPQIEKFPERFM